jgi:uncharacterized protein
MDTPFLDASAMVKRYVAEAGSAWVTSLTDPASQNVCWIADVTRVEVLAALYRRVRTGTLTLFQAQQAELVFRNELTTHFQVVALDSVIIAQAMLLVRNYPLRAYDAVQLAAALFIQSMNAQVGSNVVFISADQGLNTAASAEGLVVDNPLSHP